MPFSRMLQVGLCLVYACADSLGAWGFVGSDAFPSKLVGVLGSAPKASDQSPLLHQVSLSLSLPLSLSLWGSKYLFRRWAGRYL